MAERLEPVRQAFSAYLIERELGSGGMATVYLAHDKKHDRKVAIKILHAELSAVLGAERFLQEIRVTANLQHPHAEALNDPFFTLSGASATATDRDRTTRRLRQMLYGIAALAALFLAIASCCSMRPAPVKQVVRYRLVFDSAEAMIQPIGYFWGRLALSGDGSGLAYVGGPYAQILVRQRNQLHATAIPGSEGAQNPFFSPDGQRVGFMTGGSKLQIASLTGGPLITVTDSLIGLAGASWGRDGYIYMDGRDAEPLIRVEAKPNGVPKRFTVTDTAAGENDHAWPDVLPNGKGVLFTVGVRNGPRAIAVADIGSGKHRVIVGNAVYARYAASGHLLYVTTNRTLMIAPFDQNAMKITGEPTALVEGIRVTGTGTVDLAVSAMGTLVYTTGAATEKQELVWVTRDGKAQWVSTPEKLIVVENWFEELRAKSRK
ncbi:MAG TPA: hypothetical protein DEV93_17195 [Chloroflexi bacterium]|nr:hypothetical protein [Chloroflexota bacterium]